MSVVDAAPARSRAVWLFALPLMPFGGVLLALAAGASRARWLPVAGFLAAAEICAVVLWASARLQLRRADRLRQTEVAWGMRHRAPMWMRAMNALLPLAPGALIAAVPAALGFPRVGVGVLAIFAVVAAGLPFASFGPLALTFEADGLRFHVRGGSFIAPWATITSVDRTGPDDAQVVQIQIDDAAGVIDSYEPKQPRVLARVASCVARNPRGGGLLMLMPWTAGLDGRSIARAVDAATSSAPARAVN